MKGSSVLKVQVKTGSVTTTGKLFYGKCKNETINSYDLLAITTPSEIVYRPRLEDLL